MYLPLGFKQLNPIYISWHISLCEILFNQQHHFSTYSLNGLFLFLITVQVPLHLGLTTFFNPCAIHKEAVRRTDFNTQAKIYFPPTLNCLRILPAIHVYFVNFELNSKRLKKKVPRRRRWRKSNFITEMECRKVRITAEI